MNDETACPAGPFVSVLEIVRLDFTDTGTYVCTYNGTSNTTSIDNSTGVHLYVDDGKHLLKKTGVQFFSAVQGTCLSYFEPHVTSFTRDAISGC